MKWSSNFIGQAGYVVLLPEEKGQTSSPLAKKDKLFDQNEDVLDDTMTQQQV